MLKLRKSVALESLGPDFRQSLETAATIGAEAVEINARTQVGLEEISRTAIRQIRKWLADYRLTVAVVSFPTRRGLHDPEGIDRRISGLQRAMKFANDLGCRIVSSQGMRLPDEDDGDRLEQLRTVLEDLSRFSLKSGAGLALRTGASDGTRLAGLLTQLPDHAVGIDFDPAGLLLHGHDPVPAMKLLSSSVVHFRARDAVRDRSLPGEGAEVALGRGSVDFPALLAGLEERGYGGYVTVQRQVLPGGQAVADCSRAMEYLDNLFR